MLRCAALLGRPLLHCALLCSALLCSVVLCSAAQRSAAQLSAAQLSSAQRSAAQSSAKRGGEAVRAAHAVREFKRRQLAGVTRARQRDAKDRYLPARPRKWVLVQVANQSQGA